MDDAVLELSRRAGIDPYFLAYSLQSYAESEQLDEDAFAAQLGTTIEGLGRIRLCPSPRADWFSEDVERIAAKFQVNRETLLKIARFGQVVAQLRGDTEAKLTEPASVFLAARDRPPS
jgi:hypothetical protein